jgi:hypothetical protein
MSTSILNKSFKRNIVKINVSISEEKEHLLFIFQVVYASFISDSYAEVSSGATTSVVGSVLFPLPTPNRNRNPFNNSQTWHSASKISLHGL